MHTPTKRANPHPERPAANQPGGYVDLQRLDRRGQRGRRGRRGRRQRTTGALAAVLTVCAIVLSACGGGNGGPSAANSSAAQSSVHVTIANYAFSPASFTVKPGATVEITNTDPVAHTFTSTTGAFNTMDIQPNQTKTIHAPKKPGTYPFHCLIHQYMTGTMTVS